MVKVNRNGLMDRCIMENGGTEKCMVRDSLLNKMATKLRVNGLRERKSDFECACQLFFIKYGKCMYLK